MNPFLPADQQQDVLGNLTAFVNTIRQTLAENELDAENRMQIEDLLDTLQTDTQSAIAEVEAKIAESEAKTKSILDQAELNKIQLPPEPAVPTPEPVQPKEAPDHALGYRLGKEMLTHFGYLSLQSTYDTDALRTIHDWLEESISLAGQRTLPSDLPRAHSPVSLDRPSHETPAKPTPEPTPTSPAKVAAPQQLDLRWTAWLNNSRVVLLSGKKQEHVSENREDLWRDIFRGE
ncbi:MAG: hypothetical protein U1D30_20470 [Planctomycetota bacterium]